MKPIQSVYEAPTLTLRPILETDLEATLAWRNRSEARIWFKNTAELSLDQHRNWYRQYLQKADDLVFMVEVAGQAVGQVSVYDLDREAQTGEVGRFLVGGEHAGRGHMRAAISALLELCATSLSLGYVFLEVKVANERARRIYLGLGFVEEAINDGYVRMGKGLGKLADA